MHFVVILAIGRGPLMSGCHKVEPDIIPPKALPYGLDLLSKEP